MDNFLRYFYMDIGQVFQAFVDLIAAIGNFLNYLLNFPMRMEIIASYSSEFSTVDWIMLLVANLLPVTLGNIVGGMVLVGLPLYLIHGAKIRGEENQ